MRRANSTMVLAALALLANPINLYRYPVEKQEVLLEHARRVVRDHGHLVNASKHPAELDRMARQRARARQTHPGKRGRA